MSKRITLIFCCIILFALHVVRPLHAQTPMSLSAIQGVDASSLNDKQIQSLLQQASAQGLSVDQAIQIAKSRGATQSQIDELMKRINNSKQSATSGKVSEFPETLLDYAKDYTEKEDVVLSDKLKRIFGHQLFNTKRLSFEPSLNIPLPDDYILGVNDELTISVSGASQQTYQLTLDRNGNIYVPNVGPIYLLNMPFDDARKLVKKRLTSVFRGMSGANPTTWVEVSVTNLRSIKVNVIGEVLLPGTYTLPATASAFNALFLSGGPNENGSFREIKIIRDGKTIKVVDVYEYLLKSDVSSNIGLRDQDVILIPTYQNRVDLSGNFKRPGLYELKQDETMETLMTFSGGFSTEAFKGAVSVFRKNGAQKSMVDVTVDAFKSFLPEAGDSIVAGDVLDRYENRVAISGAVFRPGYYALTEGMKLSQLISLAQGLREDVFTNRGLIFRKGADLTPAALAFDAADVQQGRNDITLQREDSVVIQDVVSMREKRYVRIYGEVQKDGEFDFNENMTLEDLIFVSGGLKESASESYIEISRRHDFKESAKQTEKLLDVFTIDVTRDLKLTDKDKQFQLQPFDYVYIRRAPSYHEQKTVFIEGEVLYPGAYSIQSKDERISDLIKRSGGLSSHAYVEGATLFRMPDKFSIQDTSLISNIVVDSIAQKAAKQLESGRLELKLKRILKDPNSVFNYHLKEGDRIIIPEVSEEVRVAGAILNPVGLAYEIHKSAKYYIDRSGGFSDKANTKKVYVINSDGTTEVTRSFIFTTYPKVGPGGKIIVPEKEVKTGMEPAMWLAIASTFSSIAVAVAAILR